MKTIIWARWLRRPLKINYEKLKKEVKKKEALGILSKKLLICQVCGFTSYSYQDMIEHLALYVNEKNYERVSAENCIKQIIKFGKVRR